MGKYHLSHRTGWLRAAVLGANDGIVSTGALIVGVAAAASDAHEIVLAGLAGLVAGAMSMAAGEYVSVSSQADTEAADLERERLSLRDEPEMEHEELSMIYVQRGVEPELAAQVARQLMDHDALAAHARDEIGISQVLAARPVQAALASAATFSVGAALPLVAAGVTPEAKVIPVVAVICLVALAALGVVSARAGGAPVIRAVFRVTFWGAAAMAATTLVGGLFGAVGGG